MSILSPETEIDRPHRKVRNTATGATSPFPEPELMTRSGRSLVVALFFADYVGGHVTSSIQEIMVSIEGGRSGAGDGTVRLCRKSPRLSSM